MAERRVDDVVAAGARPRILIPVTEESAPGQWDAYASDYAEAVQAAGGTPIPFYYGWYGRRAIPPHDGLLIIGGEDVDPARYGEPPDRRLGPISPARDEAELALTALALADHRPLLAICRGAQLLNVAQGGTLHQHIQERAPHRVEHGSDASGWHEVTVVADSLLARIAGEGPLRVNSRHHQAVTPERLASTLVEAGRAATGHIAGRDHDIGTLGVRSGEHDGDDVRRVLQVRIDHADVRP